MTGNNLKASQNNQKDEETPSSHAEKRLWNAVLLLAAQDARSASASLRAETQLWLMSQDFITVCEWAGQFPEWIKLGIEKILIEKSDYAVQKGASHRRPNFDLV